jgi:peroxiredoxin
MVMRILFSLLLCAAALFEQRLSGQLLSGRRAPSFSLPDANQVQHDILDYRGKWLLLTFLKTSDCANCPPVSRLLEQMKKQGGGKVEVLSILLSPPENANTAARYIVDNKMTSPIVFDQSQVAIGYYRATPAHPGIDTPHLFAISPGGSIAKDWSETSLAQFINGKSNLWAELQALMNGSAK